MERVLHPASAAVAVNFASPPPSADLTRKRLQDNTVTRLAVFTKISDELHSL